MRDVAFKFCPVCATALISREAGGALRAACPACGFVNFVDPKVVVIVVLEHDGKLLLGRRNIDPQRGKWSFCSGYVERGEAVEAAAAREVKEETNLDVTVGGLLGVYSSAGSPYILIGFCAAVRGDSGAMAAEPGEVMELRFFASESLPDLAFPGDQQVLADWRKWRVQNAGF